MEGECTRPRRKAVAVSVLSARHPLRMLCRSMSAGKGAGTAGNAARERRAPERHTKQGRSGSGPQTRTIAFGGPMQVSPVRIVAHGTNGGYAPEGAPGGPQRDSSRWVLRWEARMVTTKKTCRDGAPPTEGKNGRTGEGRRESLPSHLLLCSPSVLGTFFCLAGACLTWAGCAEQVRPPAPAELAKFQAADPANPTVDAAGVSLRAVRAVETGRPRGSGDEICPTGRVPGRDAQDRGGSRRYSVCGSRGRARRCRSSLRAGRRPTPDCRRPGSEPSGGLACPGARLFHDGDHVRSGLRE